MLKFILKGIKYAVTVDGYIIIPSAIIFVVFLIIAYFKNRNGKGN